MTSGLPQKPSSGAGADLAAYISSDWGNIDYLAREKMGFFVGGGAAEGGSGQ
jgi:hypothetical protein